MGRQEAKRDHDTNNNANTGVIITFYVEKSRFASDNKSNPIKKSRKETTTTSFASDRRAQLLACAREMRIGGVHEDQVRPGMKSNPRPRPRSNNWKSKVQTILPKMSAQKRWSANYERISTEETEVVDQFCGPCRSINGKKRNKRNRSVSQLCSKIKCAFRELSCDLTEENK